MTSDHLSLAAFDIDVDRKRPNFVVKGKDVVLCALSGISSAMDVKRYTTEGVGAV